MYVLYIYVIYVCIIFAWGPPFLGGEAQASFMGLVGRAAPARRPPASPCGGTTSGCGTRACACATRRSSGRPGWTTACRSVISGGTTAGASPFRRCPPPINVLPPNALPQRPAVLNSQWSNLEHGIGLLPLRRLRLARRRASGGLLRNNRSILARGMLHPPGDFSICPGNRWCLKPRKMEKF